MTAVLVFLAVALVAATGYWAGRYRRRSRVQIEMLAARIFELEWQLAKRSRPPGPGGGPPDPRGAAAENMAEAYRTRQKLTTERRELDGT